MIQIREIPYAKDRIAAARDSVAGIVAEFNPYHTGHEYLIRQVREITGCRYVIIVMSGNFTQYGAPAIVDKYTRTKMCLSGESHADMVFEIPAVYATASAEGFAHAAVSLLEGLGVVDYLCFGSEVIDTEAMEEVTQMMVDEPQEVRTKLRSYLESGKSFPAAYDCAVYDYFEAKDGSEKADSIRAMLRNPNATLGLQYCKALAALKSKMKPVAIKRIGAGHNQASAFDETYASGSYLRELLAAGGMAKDLEGFFSKPAADILSQTLEQYGPTCEDELLPYYKKMLLDVRYRNLSYEAPYNSVEPTLLRHLVNRSADAADCRSFPDFILSMKSKNLTYTRISRLLFRLATGIGPEHPPYPVYYLRLLGFRDEDTKLLRPRIKECATLPIITKVADYESASEGFQPSERGACLAMFKTDLYTSEFYYQLQNSSGEINEFTYGVIRI